MAQRHPDPGVELGHPERLGHVVVGAALERLDLGRLLAAGRQDDDRGRRLAADPAHDDQPIAIGQAEVEQDRGRAAVPPSAGRPRPCRRPRRPGSGGAAGSGRSRPGSPRRPRRGGPSGPAGCRAVTGRRPRRRVRSGAAGRSTSTASPPSSLLPASTRPPIASVRPRTTARPTPGPRPRPGRPALDPVELLEQPGQRLGGTPGPESSTVSRTEPSTGVADTRTRVPGGDVLHGVLEQVRDDLVEEDRVDEDRRAGSIELDLERPPGEPVAEPATRPAGPRRPARAAPGRRAARPASIRLRSSRFVTSRLRCSASRSIASALARRSSSEISSCAVEHRPGRGADRRQRRPQVVRDRLEQRRLQGVALAGDLGRRRPPRAGGPARAPGRSGRPRPRAAGSPPGPAGRRSGRGTPRSSPASVRPPRSSPGGRARRARRRDGRPGWWTRTHSAGVSPGIRRSTAWLAVGAGAAPIRRCRRRPARALPRGSARPRPARGRPRSAGSRRSPGRTAIVDARVASARLTWNSATASRSRSTAASARARWAAASWPTTIPPTSRRTRLSHSPGSPTVKV